MKKGKDRKKRGGGKQRAKKPVWCRRRSWSCFLLLSRPAAITREGHF
jgi:hypothetical protein